MSARKGDPYCIQCSFRIGAIGATGLSQVRSAAAAFASQSFRACTYQSYGIKTVGHIFADAADDCAFTIFTAGCDRDHTGTDTGLFLVDESLEITRRNTLQNAADELNAADVLCSGFRTSASAQGQLFLGLRKFAFQLLAFFHQRSNAGRHICGGCFQSGSGGGIQALIRRS